MEAETFTTEVLSRHNKIKMVQRNRLINVQRNSINTTQHNRIMEARRRKLAMARPPEKLAQSLEILRNLQSAEGAGAIRARDLSRTHRERLLRNGFLQEVIKGWYIPSRPDEVKGESTAWYASFWRFCAAYLEVRFGVRWCLSSEQSLSLHAGNWTVPGQLVARSPRAGNKVTKLPHGTSLLELRIALPGVADRNEEAGLRLFSVESALIACSPNYFSNNATDVRAVLPMIRDASGLLVRLLDGGHTVIAPQSSN